MDAKLYIYNEYRYTMRGDDMTLNSPMRERVNLSPHNMITTKSICLLPISRFSKALDTDREVNTDKAYGYSDIQIKGVGIDELDEMTLACLTHKMFKENMLEVVVSCDDILDFMKMPSKERSKWRKKVEQSIDNVRHTSFSYRKITKENAHESLGNIAIHNRSFIEQYDYVENLDLFKIKMSRSYADLFIDDNYVLNMHVKVYKTIKSQYARVLFKALSNFRYTSDSIIDLDAEHVAITLSLTDKEAKRRNEQIKRAFVELVKLGFVKEYELLKKGRKNRIVCKLTKKFDMLSNEQHKLDQLNDVYVRVDKVSATDEITDDAFPDAFLTDSELKAKQELTTTDFSDFDSFSYENFKELDK